MFVCFKKIYMHIWQKNAISKEMSFWVTTPKWFIAQFSVKCFLPISSLTKLQNYSCFATLLSTPAQVPSLAEQWSPEPDRDRALFPSEPVGDSGLVRATAQEKALQCDRSRVYRYKLSPSPLSSSSLGGFRGVLGGEHECNRRTEQIGARTTVWTNNRHQGRKTVKKNFFFFRLF